LSVSSWLPHAKVQLIRMPKLYNELATWWPLLSPVADYTEEAAFFMQVLREAGLPRSPSSSNWGQAVGAMPFT
jgi:hypothetical protein